MALIFDASFESGNLAEAQLVCESPLEYDLHIRPDTLNTRHRVWFYFSVRGAIRGQKVLINLVGHSKTKSLYRDGMAPVVSSSRRPYWERMPEGCVYTAGTCRCTALRTPHFQRRGRLSGSSSPPSPEP